MQAVIMAAGESSRFWPLNHHHKTLTKIAGQAIIAWTVQELKAVGIKDIIIVQGPGRDVEKELADASLKYAVQKEPTGTGDALLRSEKFIKDSQFFLLNAEQQGVKEHAALMMTEAKRRKVEFVAASSETKTPWLFGIFKIKDGRVLDVVEKPKKGEEPSCLKNVGIYFLPREFFAFLRKMPSHPFSLIQAMSLYAREKSVVLAKFIEETLVLKYPWHLFPILQNRIVRAKIAKTAKIGAGTIIEGPCYIGENCQIGPNNVLRGPLDLEAGVKTGAFMEIKHSIVQENTHFHSGFLGDSLVGPNCRFGAGWVTANRRLDRQNIFSLVKGEKIDTNLTNFGCVVGQGAKIGIRASTMPGVFIGQEATIWPGATVFKNIADNTVFKGRNGNH